MTDYVLVRTTFDYADEFTADGANVFPRADWDRYLAEFKTLRFPRDIYFGTNEYIELTSPQKYERGLTVKEITEDQYNFFKESFPYGIGIFLDINIEEAKEEDDW